MAATIIDRIEDEMRSDTEDRRTQTLWLLAAYDAADERGKQAIDNALVGICGYRLTTLIAEEGRP